MAKLVAEGEAALKAWFPLGKQKIEKAVDLFASGAAQLKAAKSWREAAEAQMRVADCHVRLGSKYESAVAFQEAASLFKKVPDPASVHLALNRASETFLEMGKFNQAARCVKEAGEQAEADGNVELALAKLRQAADFYYGEEQTASGNQCLVRVGVVLADAGRYREAAETFEQVAAKMVEGVAKYGAAELYGKAAMCRVAAIRGGEDGEEDIDAADDAIARYATLDPRFCDQRDHVLTRALIKAFREGNVEAFKDATTDYDGVVRLDEWKTRVLHAALRVLESRTKDW